MAFFNHVKSLYITRGCGITMSIKNAHGKGADNVIDVAIRDVGTYDHKIAVFDADMPASADKTKEATKRGVYLFKSHPAIEGLLLQLLSKPVPYSTADCKTRLAQYVTGDLLKKETYAGDFTPAVLESARLRLPEWDALLDLLAARE